MALDAAGALHVAFFGREFDLAYATNASGGWQTESVDSGIDVGMFASIGLSNGAKRITYTDASWRELVLATGDLGAWQIETPSPQTPMREPTLVLDGDIPQIAYVEPLGVSGGRPAIATYANGWQLRTLDVPDDGARYPSFAIASSGVRRLVFWNQSSGELRAARWCPLSAAVSCPG